MDKIYKKILMSSSLCSGFFLAFTFGIYAPFEIYLTNVEEFWFGLEHFGWMTVICFVFIMGAIFFISKILRGKLLIGFEGILFAIALNIYLQGNFFNLKVGVMNGAEIPWMEYRVRFGINIFAWIFMCLFFLAFAIKATNKFKKFAVYASIFLTLIQFVSLIVLMIPEFMPKEENANKEIFMSDKGLFEVGDENIIVFLVDMFDDAYFKEILQDESETVEQLDGFTYFSNFTGSYSTTVYSLAHLSTGKFFYNELPRGQWIQDTAQERLYLDEIIDLGYQTEFYLDLMGCIPNRIIKQSLNYMAVPLKINGKKSFLVDLYKLVMCKYFPDVFKPFLWLSGNEFNAYKGYDSEYKPYNVNNLIFKDELEQKGVTKEAEKIFKFIHLDGVHFPYYIDENAQEVPEDSVTAIQCAKGVISILQQYFTEMKQNGTYDDSVIIIMADHGYYWDGVLTNPVFLAKPKGAKGKLVINNAPTCQGDFAATVLDLAGVETNGEYGKSAFEVSEGEERERFFYQYYLQEKQIDGNYRLIEYMIPNYANNPTNYELTGKEFMFNGRKIDHFRYCQTCQNGELIAENEVGPPRIVHQKAKDYPEK